MDIFSAYATDATLEVEGKWFPLSKTASIKVARSGNDRYIEQLRKKLEDNNIDLSSRSKEDEDLAQKVIVDVMADTILLDWKGLQFRGKDIEYSRLNARLLLQIKDFRKKVSGFSESFEAFKVAQEVAQGNDSASTSSGS